MLCDFWDSVNDRGKLSEWKYTPCEFSLHNFLSLTSFLMQAAIADGYFMYTSSKVSQQNFSFSQLGMDLALFSIKLSWIFSYFCKESLYFLMMPPAKSYLPILDNLFTRIYLNLILLRNIFPFHGIWWAIYQYFQCSSAYLQVTLKWCFPFYVVIPILFVCQLDAVEVQVINDQFCRDILKQIFCFSHI